jgi:hypothetical protein
VCPNPPKLWAISKKNSTGGDGVNAKETEDWEGIVEGMLLSI